MKNIVFVLFFIPYISFGQLSGALSNDVYACTGMPDQYLTFTGSNGTAPYTFYYNVDGGPTQTITTTSGNSVSIPISASSVVNNNYYLIQIVDDLGTSVSLSDQALVLIDQTPILDCGPDQLICTGNSTSLISSVIPSPGPFGSYTYSVNSNPIQSISNPFNFVPSASATYSVYITSVFGCVDDDQVTVTVNNYPMNPDFSIDSAGCTDGLIQITQSFETLNYTYDWITGATTSGISNLAPGMYSVDVTDTVTGCQSSFSYQVPQSLIPQNCAEITGFVYFDADENCAINAGDLAIANRMIIANPGNYLAITDMNGFYSMNLPTGTYTVQEIFNNPDYGNYCNPSYTVPLLNDSDSIGGNIFLDTLWEEIDLISYIYNIEAVPGFNFNVYSNFYSLTANASLLNADAWIKIPAGVTLQSWSYPHTISNDTIYFMINSTSSFSGVLNFAADVSLSLGSQLTFCSGIEIYQGEMITSNNTACFTTNVIGSYDPNDKTMFLNGVQSDSTIFITDETLDYVIRFQNTGTAPAQNIYILDTINTTLDLNTFQFVSSSHNCTSSILEGNVLKFNFPQIFLPDSTNNEPESHGFIRYRIRQSNQNTLGTVINNTAYIYFDFNEAVVTNTTYDIIVVDDLGIDELGVLNVKVYPNPTESILNFESESTIEAISIYTLNGKLVKQCAPSSQKAIVDLSELTLGIYLVELNCEKGRIVKRIIVQ